MKARAVIFGGPGVRVVFGWVVGDEVGEVAEEGLG